MVEDIVELDGSLLVVLGHEAHDLRFLMRPKTLQHQALLVAYR